MSKGPPIKYPLRGVEIGGTIQFHSESKEHTTRIHKSVHQAAERIGVYFSGKMDRKTRVITFTRIR